MKILIIFFLCTSYVKASEIATVVKAKGIVYKAFSNKKPLKKGSLLKRKDVLITEKSSFVRIKMLDDTVITLGSNSSLMLQRFRFTNKEKRAFSIKLMRGKLRANIVNKSKSDSLKFETDSVSLGVRGTELLMNAGEVTKVAVISGRVAVFNKLDDTVKELVAGAQFISIINKDKSMFDSKFLKLKDEKFQALAASTNKTFKSGEEVVVGSSMRPSKDSSEDPLNESLFLDDSTELLPVKELEEGKKRLFK
ncbi:MAG: hypothetical protein ACJAT2_000650 [Bacteriovoracaceae bacterium]|jgi:hypothetical protein